MKFNLYSIWMDPMFYLAAAVFALAMFFLVFSIRKYLEVKNHSDFEETGAESVEVQGELPMQEEASSGDDISEPVAAAQSAELRDVTPEEPHQAPSGEPHASSRAEEFVKGLYQSMTSLDGRMKNIESAFSKASVNRDFTVTFLEDIMSDFDSLDKEKIKARIEYLLSDLKK